MTSIHNVLMEKIQIFVVCECIQLVYKKQSKFSKIACIFHKTHCENVICICMYIKNKFRLKNIYFLDLSSHPLFLSMYPKARLAWADPMTLKTFFSPFLMPSRILNHCQFQLCLMLYKRWQWSWQLLPSIMWVFPNVFFPAPDPILSVISSPFPLSHHFCVCLFIVRKIFNE